MRRWLYLLVIAIGLLQSIGYVTGCKVVRQLGQVSGSSPLPIVFTEVKGLETFASSFFIQFTNKAGAREEVLITPAMYSRLKGPYNRRNVYGAVISYGPVLKKELWEPVLSYGICRGVLQREMGLPLNGSDYAIRIKTNTAGRADEWIIKPSCTR
jgi:hypothetical protein